MEWHWWWSVFLAYTNGQPTIILTKVDQTIKERTSNCFNWYSFYKMNIYMLVHLLPKKKFYFDTYNRNASATLSQCTYYHFSFFFFSYKSFQLLKIIENWSLEQRINPSYSLSIPAPPCQSTHPWKKREKSTRCLTWVPSIQGPLRGSNNLFFIKKINITKEIMIKIDWSIAIVFLKKNTHAKKWYDTWAGPSRF